MSLGSGMRKVIVMCSMFMLISGSFSALAAAKGHEYSARIDAQGKVEAQSAHWIESVDHVSQTNYGASYKVNIVPGAFQKEPKYCHVSTYDNSTYEHTLYGVAKLSSKPTRETVNVIGLMLGLDKPSGDSSMSFYLVCGK